MSTASDLNKTTLSQFVDRFILSCNSTNTVTPDSYLQNALSIAAQTLELEHAAIFHRCDMSTWNSIIAIKSIRDNSDDHTITDTAIMQCSDLSLFIKDKIDGIEIGETYTESNIPFIDNITLIPFKSFNLQFCLVFINKLNPIEPNSDIYYLQQHYRLFKGFFEFASSGTASLADLWRQSLFGGSRSSIRERTNDFIRSFSQKPNLNSFDFILATGIDAETQLMIMPPKQTTFSYYDTLSKIDFCADTQPFTRFALIRREIWIQSQYGLIKCDTIDSILSFLKSVDQAPAHISDLKLQNIKFSNSVLDDEMSVSLANFYFSSVFDIEKIKTYLFLLYHISHSQEDVIDGTQINKADKLFCDINKFNNHLNLHTLLKLFLNTWGDASEGHLVVSSEWLFIWFGVKMLNSPNLFKNVLDKYPPDFRANFYKHFSCYYLYIIFLIRCCGEPSLFRFSDVPGGFETFISSSLFLIAEYTHKEKGLDITVPLHTALQDIWSKEAILYTVRDNYRDHFHHVWNVCLLGLVLIDAGLLEKIDPMWNSYDEDHIRKIHRNWILAGLLHDIGYSLDINSHTLKHLETFSKVPCISQFSKKLATCLEEAEQSLCSELANTCSFFTANKLDHGVTSSAYLYHLNCLQHTEINIQTFETWGDEISMAAEAISKHNLKGLDINPQKSPMSFLLLLCDHLQEWDRPRLSGEKLRRSFSLNFHSPRQGHHVGHDIVRRLESSLVWDDNRIHITNNKLFLNLIYRNADKEKFEPAMIWCQNSEDFQNIDLANFPEDFSIELSATHPISDKLLHLSRTEMELFEDFCRQDDLRLHLAKWCLLSRNGKPIRIYGSDTKTNTETYTWKFFKSIPCNKIEHFPSGVYKDFTLWKERTIRKLQIVKMNSNP